MLSVAPVSIQKYNRNGVESGPDLVVVEEPLQIRLGYGPADDRQQQPLVVTLRTPGPSGPAEDEELALGYLFSEGIIRQLPDVLSCRYCSQDSDKQTNDLRVELHPDVAVDWSRLERSALSSSACGLCGKTSIEHIRNIIPEFARYPRRASAFVPKPGVVLDLPEQLRAHQRAFAHTGGLHAAALFDETGRILLVREDVGRHNALDKLVGAALKEGWLPLKNHGVLVSGRVGFELVQKCWMAGVPLLAAVGAPTSLAVEMAQEAGMTLIGFIRNGNYNLYTSA